MSRSSASPGAFSRGQSPLPLDHRRALLASPQNELASLSTAIPPLGTSFSDLRATVASQQRQMDSLIDKVASLLSAMHTEVLDDVRKTCRPDSTAGAKTLIPKDVVHLVDLRETEGGLRVWMQGQLRDARDHLETKLQEVQYRLTNEMRDVHGRFSGDVHNLRARVSHLEELIDDDEAAELRRDMETRFEAYMGQMQESMGTLAEGLSQQLEARLEASMEARPDNSQLAEEVITCVEKRIQEHGTKDGGVLAKLRDQMRQEAETRLEAKMAQTFGLAQRLMNELRQELQGQVLQVHESSQHLAIELSRSLEAQEKHIHRTLQHLLCEVDLDSMKKPSSKSQNSQGNSSAVVEEHLAGCRAAAADCARCASEASAMTDSMEERFNDLSQHLVSEIQRNLEAQEAQVYKSLQRVLRDELQRGLEAARPTRPEGKGSQDSTTGATRSVADCAVSASETSTAAESLEIRFNDLAMRLAGELREDTEALEARLCESLEQLVRNKALTSGGTEKHLADCRAAAVDCRQCVEDASATAQVAEKHLVACRVAAADCQRCLGDVSAKSDALELRLRVCTEVSAHTPSEEQRGKSVREGDAPQVPGTMEAGKDGVDDLPQRFMDLEEEVAGLRQLLLAMRDRVLGCMPQGDEEEAREQGG